MAHLEEDLQLGRHEAAAGDAALRDQLRQVLRVPVAPGHGKHQLRPHRKGKEQLPHRDVEADGCLLEEDVFGTQVMLAAT